MLSFFFYPTTSCSSADFGEKKEGALILKMDAREDKFALFGSLEFFVILHAYKRSSGFITVVRLD